MSKQIFLTGIVDDWASEEVRWQIDNSSEKRIDLYVSNWGGSVNKGFEIANYIQGVNASGKKEIHTYNLSHADSIATVVFLAPPKEQRHILESSTLFTHEPRVISIDAITKDDAAKLEIELEMQTNRIADFYVRNIEGLDKNEALAMMKGEENLNAEKMLSLGIVTEIVPEFEIAATRKALTNFNYTKMGLFGNKEKQPINTVALEDGSQLLYSGEFKEGTELHAIGEVRNLSGEHVTNDGQTLVIDDSNKLVKVMDKVEETTETAPITIEAIAALIDEKLTEHDQKIDDKINALRSKGSSTKLPKIENNGGSNKVIANERQLQAEAGAQVREELNKIQAAKNAKKNANI